MQSLTNQITVLTYDIVFTDVGKKIKKLICTIFWVFMAKDGQLFSVHQLQLYAAFQPYYAYLASMHGLSMLKCNKEPAWRWHLF